MTPLAALADRIEAQFRLIAATRMAGIPVVNDALCAGEDGGVSMRGLARVGEYHMGVLVTPWFMNLVGFPLRMPDPAPAIGGKANLPLPSGLYEGIWNFEDALGGFWSCSLFSPMFEFADMETAIATADAAWAELMTAPEAPSEEESRAGALEASVMPAAPRGVEERLAEEERARTLAEQAASKDDVEQGDRKALDRRALFGLGRGEPAQTAAGKEEAA